MKKRVLVGAVVAAAALIGAPPVEATPSSAAHVLGPVVLNGDGTASVTVQYVCPVQGSHVWMSAKQVEDRHPDKRLAGEGSSGISSLMGVPLREARESFEREYLRVQIRRFSGNISKTAGFIGMERSALHRKLKILGMGERKEGDDSEGEDS